MISSVIELLILIGAAAAFCPAPPFLGQFRFLLEINSSFSNLYCPALFVLGLLTVFRGKRQRAIAALILAASHGAQLIPGSAEITLPVSKTFSVLYSNVWIHNEPERVRQTINALDPDLIALTEVNQHWLAKLELGKRYPYSFLQPGISADGGAIYSKLPLSDAERFPARSYFAALGVKVQPESGEPIHLFFVHAPPPQVDLELQGRDALIGELAAKVTAVGKDRSVVFGDFNTAFSSPALSAYRRQLGLRDAFSPYWYESSWHIREVPFVRTRIDHIFAGAGLQVPTVSIQSDLGSDHFPILFQIGYARSDK